MTEQGHTSFLSIIILVVLSCASYDSCKCEPRLPSTCTLGNSKKGVGTIIYGHIVHKKEMNHLYQWYDSALCRIEYQFFVFCVLLLFEQTLILANKQSVFSGIISARKCVNGRCDLSLKIKFPSKKFKRPLRPAKVADQQSCRCRVMKTSGKDFLALFIVT